MKLAGHVARMKETRNTYNIILQSDLLEDLCVDEKVILKLTLKK
jgi:hypothetical protein